MNDVILKRFDFLINSIVSLKLLRIILHDS